MTVDTAIEHLDHRFMRPGARADEVRANCTSCVAELAALKLSRSETEEQYVARIERDHPGYFEAGDAIVAEMDRRAAARAAR